MKNLMEKMNEKKRQRKREENSTFAFIKNEKNVIMQKSHVSPTCWLKIYRTQK